MNHHLIEINHLEKSPDNARRTVAKGASASLKASILAHGLMQNLVVTEAGDGRYYVIEGARRLEALQALQAEGKLPQDHPVPCQIVSTELAMEKSLAANTIRLAMHPADEFEAFAKLIDEGASPSEIAERFGVESRHVLQRLKLGKVAGELLSAYRAGEMTLDCLMAFTITDDQDRQLAVWQGLQSWQKTDAKAIRAAITGALPEAGSKLARFVGLEAYREAGGTVRSDLFSEETYLENPELLHTLASGKLRLEAEALKAEGWGWVEATMDYDWQIVSGCTRIYPDPSAVPADLIDRESALEQELEEVQAALEETESDALLDHLDALEQEHTEAIQAIRDAAAYDPEEMALAGCYVTIGYDGELRIDRGLVRPGDRKGIAASASDARHEAKPKSMPDTLRRDLESYRLQVSQAEIARNPAIAFDLLVFTAASAEFGSPVFTGPEVRFVHHPLSPKVQEERTISADILGEVRASLPLEWIREGSEAARFRAFSALPQAAKLELLAWCVAQSLRPQLLTGREETAVELALASTCGDVAAYWRPDQQNFLGRITRDQLLALGGTLLGEEWAAARGKDRKGELATKLERAFAEPEKPGRTAEQAEALKRWLPEGMAFLTADPCEDAAAAA